MSVFLKWGVGQASTFVAEALARGCDLIEMHPNRISIRVVRAIGGCSFGMIRR